MKKILFGLMIATIFAAGVAYSPPIMQAMAESRQEKQTQAFVDFSRYPDMPKGLQASIIDVLKQRSDKEIKGSYFVIMDYDSLLPEGYISIAALDGPSSVSENLGNQDSADIIAYRKSNKGWDVGVRGSLGFNKILDESVDRLGLPEDKEMFKRNKAYFQESNTFVEKVGASSLVRFPWPSTTTTGQQNPWTMTWGWHEGNAQDFAPTTSDSRVLVSLGGTVGPICTGVYTKNVTVFTDEGTFQYFHIDKNTLSPYIYTGTHVTTGQLIGNASSLNYVIESEGCGTSGGLHLHWIVPFTIGFEANGWVATKDNDALGNNDYWYKVVDPSIHITKGSLFYSSNVANTGKSTACDLQNVTRVGEVYSSTINNPLYNFPTPLFSCNALDTLITHDTSVTDSADVTYRANNTVRLEDGFSAGSLTGSGIFRAYIN